MKSLQLKITLTAQDVIHQAHFQADEAGTTIPASYQKLAKDLAGLKLTEIWNLPLTDYEDPQFREFFFSPLMGLIEQEYNRLTGEDINFLHLKAKEDIVCPCFGLTRQQIVTSSSVDLANVTQDLKVGTGCGSCLKNIDSFMQSFQEKADVLMDSSQKFCSCHQVLEKTLAAYLMESQAQQNKMKGIATLAATQCELCRQEVEAIKKEHRDYIPPHLYGSLSLKELVENLQQLLAEFDSKLELREIKGYCLYLNHLDFEIEKLRKFLLKKIGLYFFFSVALSPEALRQF